MTPRVGGRLALFGFSVRVHDVPKRQSDPLRLVRIQGPTRPRPHRFFIHPTAAIIFASLLLDFQLLAALLQASLQELRVS
jgi:hypothetical protein